MKYVRAESADSGIAGVLEQRTVITSGIEGVTAWNAGLVGAGASVYSGLGQVGSLNSLTKQMYSQIAALQASNHLVYGQLAAADDLTGELIGGGGPMSKLFGGSEFMSKAFGGMDKLFGGSKLVSRMRSQSAVGVAMAQYLNVLVATTAVTGTVESIGNVGSVKTATTQAAAGERSERLRKLAEWSVTEADLDWDHLDAIDQLGWGAEPED